MKARAERKTGGGGVKYFTCRRPRHKSYDCPDKPKKPSEPGKGARVTAGQPTAKRVNWARAGVGNYNPFTPSRLEFCQSS